MNDSPSGAHSDDTDRRIGLLTTDLDLVVKSWDKSLERMTGIPADTVKGRRLEEVVPDLHARGLLDVLREPLVSGAAQVLAPAIHKFLIPCPPLEPSPEFDRMQQRVVIGALRDDQRAVGLVVTIEDVTTRMERERELGRRLRDAEPAERLAAIEQLSRLSSIDGLGPLGDAIADDHWQVRRAAVRAIAGRTDAALVDTIVAALREGHRDFSVLSSALQLLTLTGLDLTRSLIGLLEDSDADLRVQAALGLGSQRNPEATTALIGALDDDDSNVCFHAIEALGKLRAGAAVQRLVAIAQSRDFFLAFPAVESLVQIGDPSSAASLVPLLGDPMLSASVAEALGRIGDEDAIPALVDALRSEDSPVVALVGAIASIHHRQVEVVGDGAAIEDLVRRTIDPSALDRILNSVGQAEGDALRQLIVVVSWLKGEAIPRALATLLGRTSVHHNVVEALVRFGAPAVELLIAQLSDEDLNTRRSAVIALGRIGDRRAVPALVSLLASDDRDLLVHIEGALSRIGDARAFEPLLLRLGDDDAAVRQAAIGALNSIGDPRMGARMAQLLDDSNPRVRESAVRIAGYFGYADCVEALVRSCSDADEGVRVAALEHLPFLEGEDDRAIRLLQHALERDSPRARAGAARALGDMGTKPHALLKRALADADPWVRYFAAVSLGRLGDPAAVTLLQPLAESDPARPVRVAAVEAIGLLGGDEAPTILSELTAAREDDLANAAVRALGRLRAASSGATLRSVLRSPDARRRATAVAAIAAWAHEESVDLLSWTAASDADRSVASAAMAGLVTLAASPAPIAERAVEALTAALADGARHEEAVARLAKIPPSAIPWLAPRLDADNPDIRRGVVEALGRMSHPTASAYLQRALDDGDALVRKRAVSVLARLGTRGVIQRLAQMARADASPAVREAATHAMARRHFVDRPVTERAEGDAAQ